MTQDVYKLIFGDRDEISSHRAGLGRNNDSPTFPCRFNNCADGPGIRVFTRPGAIADIRDDLAEGLETTPSRF